MCWQPFWELPWRLGRSQSYNFVAFGTKNVNEPPQMRLAEFVCHCSNYKFLSHRGRQPRLHLSASRSAALPTRHIGALWLTRVASPAPRMCWL
ncbi:hypothetical protein Y032_0016g3104 [Ancylostoma ceylanicum]|uniref:Uncharacterized protein n=1 Tax=Ancylostoma ceylanicum TaxID=53326 RepID=A0A016V6M9_9BILA|nr:hypothetical protein Y032_0016g3104 [Ancylostoma ceylanicum]